MHSECYLNIQFELHLFHSKRMFKTVFDLIFLKLLVFLLHSTHEIFLRNQTHTLHFILNL